MNSGYSGTPLEKKLGLKDQYICALSNAPETYINWFKNLALDIKISENPNDKQLDFVHAFCKTLDDLEHAIDIYKPQLKTNAMLWVSWPKGKSNIETTLKREPVRDYVLANGLVDVKVAAIDDDWSGLKFVYRLKDRK